LSSNTDDASNDPFGLTVRRSRPAVSDMWDPDTTDECRRPVDGTRTSLWSRDPSGAGSLEAVRESSRSVGRRYCEATVGVHDRVTVAAGDGSE
jgi:hypothetical protein